MLKIFNNAFLIRRDFSLFHLGNVLEFLFSLVFFSSASGLSVVRNCMSTTVKKIFVASTHLEIQTQVAED